MANAPTEVVEISTLRSVSSDDRRPDPVGGEPSHPVSDSSPGAVDETGRVAIVTADLPAPTEGPGPAATDLLQAPSAGATDRGTAKRRPQKPSSLGSGRRNGSEQAVDSIDPGLVNRPDVDPPAVQTAGESGIGEPTRSSAPSGPAVAPDSDDHRATEGAVDRPARRSPTLGRLLQRFKEPFDATRAAQRPGADRAARPDDEMGDLVELTADRAPAPAPIPPPAPLPPTARTVPADLPGAVPTALPGPPATVTAALPTPAPNMRAPMPPDLRTVPLVPTALPSYVDIAPDPELDHEQVPTAPPNKRVVRSTAVTGRRRPRIRRVTRVVRHVDPWSVFKVAACFSVVLYGVCLTAGVLLWNVAYTTGTIDNVERFFESFGWDTFEFKGGELYHNAWVGGLFAAVGLTGFIVLGATLFNLITDLVGGVRVTVLEEEVVERDPLLRRAVLGAGRPAPRPVDPYDPDAPLDDDLGPGFGSVRSDPMPAPVDGARSSQVEPARDLRRPR